MENYVNFMTHISLGRYLELCTRSLPAFRRPCEAILILKERNVSKRNSLRVVFSWFKYGHFTIFSHNLKSKFF